MITERPDAILNIIDGTNLERNLYLTTQLTELGIPVVIAINMMDVVKKNGDKINVNELSRQLGCEIVEISALKGTGVMEAAEAAVKAAKSTKTVPMHTFSGPVEHAIAHIASVFTFLFVGRIVGDKGINELVEAFVKLHHEHKGTRLLLVGNYEQNLDPVSEATRRLIDSTDAICAPGPKCADQLVEAYASADCFVMPSYREGFPNTVLEAGAMGLPSIVTDINGSREIIEHGRNGIIVPPKDAPALLQAMERMLTDAAMRCRMAQEARPMIASRFERGFVQQCQINFYQEILQ